MKKEEKIKRFEEYLSQKKLKYSEQRMGILNVFLDSGKHLSANELYRIAQKKYPSVGFATIYRTLKLLCECGICRELKFDDGTTRYDQHFGHQHHDHLICTHCGKLVEVFDPQIELLQEKLFKANGFSPQRHRLELYGLCRSCKK